ncbi:MAG: class I SAM-dependent methyltransferase, partial [Youngiibacter sp.]|nr:class I SAM-dependent methyltransferase [Youngiibacter sp.]
MELKFYEILATHYDDIFPLSGNTLSFLSEGLEPEAKVLDAACGTGTYAIALAGKGFQTVGVDIDESMVAIAETKAVMLDADADFIVSDMMDIDLVCTDEMDMIFCIGNSLVHLKDRKQALDFIRICHGLLKPGGSMILQIVNYDRILDESLTSLPTIEVKEKDITFVRNYKLDPD